MNRIAELFTVRRLVLIAAALLVITSWRMEALRKSRDLAARPWAPEKSIEMLASSDPLLRSFAIDDLLLQGGDGIDHLIRGAKSDAEPTSSLCVETLVQCLYHDDPAVQGAAIDALHTLFREARIMVAAKARDTLKHHEERITECCVAALEQSGGMVRYFQQVDPERPKVPAAVVLGPEWSGDHAELRWIERFPMTPTLFLVNGDEVSADALAELQQQSEDLLVQHRGPTCIGLTLREGLVIMGVEPDSPADRAGLMLDENVERINGVTVDTFEEFIGAISSQKPGDVIEMTLNSQGGLREVSLELGTDLLTGQCECVSGPMPMPSTMPNS